MIHKTFGIIHLVHILLIMVFHHTLVYIQMLVLIQV